MSSSTLLPPNAPMTNGTPSSGHGEADVSSSSHLPASHSLQHVCALLHTQVASFLSAPPPDEVTKRTQEQTRIAMDVIHKTFEDYE